MSRHVWQSGLILVAFSVLVALCALNNGNPAAAETCLSPFVKRLDRPEKILYVFCVDADAKDHDFLAVIDVDLDSPKYGKIIYQLDLGSSGNETHHFGFTDDRTHIWGCSLFSSRVFLIDVASNPAKPSLVKVIEDIPEKTGLSGPHSPYALPGRMLLSFLGSKDGGLPAGLAEFTNDGQFIRRLDLPEGAPYMYDVSVKADLNRMVTSSFTPLNNYKKPLAQMDLKDFGNKLLVWDFRERKVLAQLTTGTAPLNVAGPLPPAAIMVSRIVRSMIRSGSGKEPATVSTLPASSARRANYQRICGSRPTIAFFTLVAFFPTRSSNGT